jgi:SAM-dependent methyltransferase
MWGYGKRLRFVDEAMLREFPERKRCELSILDVGCGNGSQLAIPLAAAGYQITALDPHQRSIERGRSLAPGLNFVHGVVTDLPPVKFDCVILSEVLEHLHAPEALLRAALGYLADCGILIITVPNGYGEFEIDKRAYQTLRADKLVSWLVAVWKKHPDREDLAASDDESPHIQRFTMPRLHAMFVANGLRLIKARGTSLASGPFVLHALGRFESFIRLNAAITEYLPVSFASGWMFCLRPATLMQPPGSP